ncbi:unnamed protein product [Miscanthus lutarioriparius]|uniref:Uncharacterized protein n=1 Tax=Miscanthus lutarioriparius TaxID=422564 RepID=A0A811MB43_9POAL|nr:unnamed protein product [Miscanthus lutarioriparius]
MAAGGDGVARQAKLRWIEGNVCFKKVPSSMQEPPSHPKPPPRALMRAPPSTPPYMVKVTILPPPLPLLRLLAFCQTVTRAISKGFRGWWSPDVQPCRSLLPASLRRHVAGSGGALSPGVPRSGVDKGHKASGDSLRVREPDSAQAS